MSNNITIKGNVCKDAELRYTPKQDAIASFTLADNQGYGDNKSVTFWRVTIFGKRAETLAPMILKGATIDVVGEASMRPWTNKDGVEQQSLEVRANDVWLGKKPEGQSQPAPQERATTAASNAPSNDFGDDPFDDRIPF